MFIVSLKRATKSGWLSFRRNGLLSTAAIIMMSLTLFVIGGLLLMGVISNMILADVEEKIDISVYFTPGVDEGAILKVKSDIVSLPEVASVAYISQEEALATFQERHKDDEVIVASLDELGGDNPLGAALNIKAGSPDQLAGIAEILSGRKYDGVDKINYTENQDVIERLSSVIGGVRTIGLGIVLVLTFVAVLVAFNSVRLAIYTAREEINIMKLVGASNWFVRGPFLVTGVLHGAFSALATSVAFFPVVWLVSPKIAFFMPRMDLFQYFTTNFFEFFGIMVAFGIGLGVFSSAIAVRKYLNV